MKTVREKELEEIVVALREAIEDLLKEAKYSRTKNKLDRSIMRKKILELMDDYFGTEEK